MTHTVCTQSKPSLSVRTRAVTNKCYMKLANRYLLLRNAIELRLRYRGKFSLKVRDMNHCYGIKKLGLCNSQLHSKEAHVSSISKDDTPSANIAPCTTSLCVSDTSSASSTSSGSNVQLSVCKWENCESSEIEKTQLVNHIQQVHVLPQLISNRRKHYCCLWRDCRVFGRPSVSAAWLERHVLHHTDAKGKPLRCIFDSCMMRFSTPILLERHVQRTHMRVNRTILSKDSISTHPTQIIGPLYPSDCFKSTSVSTENPGKQLESSTPTKKNSRRKKRPRLYRVRRVDFYDSRSQNVIRNHLKISHILQNQLNELVSGCPKSCVMEGESLHNLPPKLLESPVRHRLRSFMNVSDSFASKNPLTLSSIFTSQHISLLLTVPHTFVGQRISEGHQHEYLVRWTSDYGQHRLPPTWIHEEDLRLATHLENKL